MLEKNIKKQILKTIFGLFAASLYTNGLNTAFARWVTVDDKMQDINYIKCHIYVNNDGTSKTIKELESTLLKDPIKGEWAHFYMPYNTNISTLKILEAKTIINNKQYPVGIDKIEDKPIASNNKSFDQINRITIAYPNLDLEAKVFLKAEEAITHTPIDHYYHNMIFFPYYSYVKSSNTSIVSELPLYVEKNDPNQLIEILQTTKKENNKTLYLIDIKQKKPFIQGIIDESGAIINPKHIPCISISSMKNWSDYGKILAIDYEKIKQEPLPKLYQEIANLAKAQKDPIQKINTVTSLLAEKINYLTDLRTIKGRIIPQHLQKVADDRLGDCKDFSMATSVILKSIGLSSKVALVQRGERALTLPLTLPNPAHFNHAIVKVELPNNEVLWIDPTNFESMANHIFPDIANRQALVLDTKNAHLEMIPPIDPTKNTLNVIETWSMKNPSLLDIKGSLKLAGSSSKNFTGLQKTYSNESIKHFVATQLNDNYGQILERDILLPSLTSRIVEDLSFDYTIRSRNYGLQTNAGIAVPLLFKPLKHFETKKDTVSDIYLGAPQVINVHTTIEDIKASDIKPLNCKIESPWVDFIRTVDYKENHIVINQTMKLKKSWLEGTELGSEAYKNLQLALAEHVTNGIAIVFKNP